MANTRQEWSFCAFNPPLPHENLWTVLCVTTCVLRTFYVRALSPAVRETTRSRLKSPAGVAFSAGRQALVAQPAARTGLWRVSWTHSFHAP